MTSKTFNLVKYFSQTSALLIFIVSIAIGFISFKISKSNLKDTSELLHHKLTKMLSNVIEEDLAFGVEKLNSLDKKRILEQEVFKTIDSTVRNLFRNSDDILKVKILNLNAKVIYSTDVSQVGGQQKIEYITNNSARIGKIFSRYETKTNWESLKGKLNYVEALGSYIPIVINKNGHKEVIAIAEIYSDIGLLNEKIFNNSVIISLSSFSLMAILYFLLLLIVKRGEKIISTQSDQIEHHKEQLFVSAKLNALGEMAGGIAHEINNPLTIIDGKARRIQKIIDNQDDSEFNKISEHAQSIQATVNRISVIVKGLKNISRNGEKDPFQSVNISNIVEETLSLCSENFKHSNIELEVVIEPKNIFIDCRYVQISQCLLNLVTNAYQAIENLPVKKISIKITSQNELVTMTITDSGKGIPFDLRAKIFEPMFTTKEVGVGTGLGLSVTAAIIKQHRGVIFIDNNVSNTSFVIQLPLNQNQKLAA